MSDKKWTSSQSEALKSRNCNLLLSAAAGSGKTAVLVERIIRRITDLDDPTDVTDLLVLTFTKAAASEMKSRVTIALNNALSKAAKEHNEKLVMHLHKQIALMSGAQFSTLDSFFLGIVRQYFYLINIPPDISIINNQKELYLMQQEILSEILEKYYSSNDKDFLNCADMFAGKFRDTKLKEIILKLYTFSCSMPFPEEWLSSLSTPYKLENTTSIDELPYTKIILTHLHNLAKEWEDNYRIMFNLIEKEKALMNYTETLSEELAAISILCNAKTWKEWHETINEITFRSLKPVKKTQAENPEALEIYKTTILSARKNIKDKLKEIAAMYFAIDEARLIEEMKKTCPTIEILSKITTEFYNEYLKRKQKESTMEFSDTTHYALNILIKKHKLENGKQEIELSEAAKELQKKYKEIMIDEYQDTNSIQELITTLISNGRNLFMVGDLKQSIYRFRMADHTIFLDKYSTFTKDENAKNRLIVLNKNFRSDHALLSSINYIFRQIMNPEILELSYNDDEALHAGRLQETPPDTYIGNKEHGSVSINIINNKELEEKISDLDKSQIENGETEIRYIAEEIKNIINNELTVTNPDGTYRKAEYKDIAILARSLSKKASLFLKIFNEYNIPAATQNDDNFLDATETKILRALLEIIDNPYRDLPLVAVLRSYFANMDETEFAKIAIAKNELKTQTWWETLPLTEKYVSEKTFKKIKKFIEKYNNWKDYSLNNSISELLQHILEETGYMTYISGLAEGTFRKSHIENFYKLALDFDEKEKNGLYRFLYMLEKLTEEGRTPEGKSIKTETNAVQIMTIHKSKGLEYPIVFLVNCNKTFNETDYRTSYITHKTMGLGLHYYSKEHTAHWPTLYWYATKEDSIRSNKAEEARLLYVAMTRAKDKLYITGTTKDFLKDLEKWTISLNENSSNTSPALLESHIISTAKNYLDWIMPAVMGHKTLYQAWNMVNTQPKIQKDAPTDRSNYTLKSISAINYLPPEIKRKYAQTNEQQNTKENTEENALEFFKPENDTTVPERLNRQLTWTYPYPQATKTPVKLTATQAVAMKNLEENRWTGENENDTVLVTEIDETKENETPKENEIPPEFRAEPEFMQESKPITGTSYGTLMHKTMELLPFEKLENETEITNEITKLKNNNSITDEEYEILTQKGKHSPVTKIMTFIKSPLGNELKNASEIKKEMPFSILLPANDFYKNCEKGEKIFMQGIIDCMFETDGKITIIDYKTDKTKNEEKLVNHYKTQLQIYANAASKILKKEIKNIYIWSFSIGKAIKVPMK